MMACLSDGMKQCRKELLTVTQQRYLVVFEGQCEVLVDIQVNECLVIVGQLQALLLHILHHGALRELVE